MEPVQVPLPGAEKETDLEPEPEMQVSEQSLFSLLPAEVRLQILSLIDRGDAGDLDTPITTKATTDQVGDRLQPHGARHVRRRGRGSAVVAGRARVRL